MLYTIYVCEGHFKISCVHPFSWKELFAKNKSHHCTLENAILTYSKGFSPSRNTIGSTKCDQSRPEVMVTSRRRSPRSKYWIPSTWKYQAVSHDMFAKIIFVLRRSVGFTVFPWCATANIKLALKIVPTAENSDAIHKIENTRTLYASMRGAVWRT